MYCEDLSGRSIDELSCAAINQTLSGVPLTAAARECREKAKEQFDGFHAGGKKNFSQRYNTVLTCRGGATNMTAV